MKKKFNDLKNTCHVTFSLHHEANFVTILGDFTDWNPINLSDLGDNNFEITLEIPMGRDYHFRYLINDDYWENDPDADRYAISPIYDNTLNSILILSDYIPKVKKTASVKKTETTEKVVASKRAVATSKTTEDDLTKIEGIGPKIAGLLKADGIDTFEKLSKTKVTMIQAILDKAGNRYAVHNPATWADQAKIAAKGD